MFPVLTLLPLLAAVGIIVYTITNFDRLRPVVGKAAHFSKTEERLSVADIAGIEQGLTNLSHVIVIADQIEKPDGALIDAVQFNFKRGIKYLFLVSAHRAEEEVNGYYKMFETLAGIVIRKSKLNKSISDLVDIQQLTYDWDDFPHIFYRMQESSGVKTIAFRGDQVREGIANGYLRVEPSYAHTIARAVIADAPKPLTHSVSMDQFDVRPETIKFDSPTKRSRDVIQ